MTSAVAAPPSSFSAELSSGVGGARMHRVSVDRNADRAVFASVLAACAGEPKARLRLKASRAATVDADVFRSLCLQYAALMLPAPDVDALRDLCCALLFSALDDDAILFSEAGRALLECSARLVCSIEPIEHAHFILRRTAALVSDPGAFALAPESRARRAALLVGAVLTADPARVPLALRLAASPQRRPVTEYMRERAERAAAHAREAAPDAPRSVAGELPPEDALAAAAGALAETRFAIADPVRERCVRVLLCVPMAHFAASPSASRVLGRILAAAGAARPPLCPPASAFARAPPRHRMCDAHSGGDDARAASDWFDFCRLSALRPPERALRRAAKQSSATWQGRLVAPTWRTDHWLECSAREVAFDERLLHATGMSARADVLLARPQAPLASLCAVSRDLLCSALSRRARRNGDPVGARAAELLSAVRAASFVCCDDAPHFPSRERFPFAAEAARLAAEALAPRPGAAPDDETGRPRAEALREALPALMACMGGPSRCASLLAFGVVLGHLAEAALPGSVAPEPGPRPEAALRLRLLDLALALADAAQLSPIEFAVWVLRTGVPFACSDPVVRREVVELGLTRISAKNFYCPVLRAALALHGCGGEMAVLAPGPAACGVEGCGERCLFDELEEWAARWRATLDAVHAPGEWPRSGADVGALALSDCLAEEARLESEGLAPPGTQALVRRACTWVSLACRESENLHSDSWAEWVVVREAEKLRARPVAPVARAWAARLAGGGRSPGASADGLGPPQQVIQAAGLALFAQRSCDASIEGGPCAAGLSAALEAALRAALSAGHSEVVRSYASDALCAALHCAARCAIDCSGPLSACAEWLDRAAVSPPSGVCGEAVAFCLRALHAGWSAAAASAPGIRGACPARGALRSALVACGVRVNTDAAELPYHVQVLREIAFA